MLQKNVHLSFFKILLTVIAGAQFLLMNLSLGRKSNFVLKTDQFLERKYLHACYEVSPSSDEAGE